MFHNGPRAGKQQVPDLTAGCLGKFSRGCIRGRGGRAESTQGKENHKLGLKGLIQKCAGGAVQREEGLSG